MANLESKIIAVKDILQMNNLLIPPYQRPYKWTAKNVNQLIDDILFHKDKSAYRLGTLVIHKENDKLNIVDGQQRTITLALIAHALKRNEKLKDIKGLTHFETNLTKLQFSNDISKTNIQNNYNVIERRINEFDEASILFLFNKCELVEVVLTDVSEAFQFFDSQNARGKDLEPHDLLKAFHLREMNNSSEEERQQKVENWEAMDTNKLSGLLTLYLYRIRNWSKGCSARYFTKDDVDVFKGVSPEIQEDYPFTKIYRIAHHYTENYNQSYHRKIDKNDFGYPFQIDQIIINGKRFFEMIDYYDNMLKNIIGENYYNYDTFKDSINSQKIIDLEKKCKEYSVMKQIRDYEGSYRTGDKYIRNLFYCGLIYYVDKFGENELPKAIDKIFVWAYTLRLKLSRLGLESIDNYALHNGTYSQIQLFKEIREAIRPNDIFNITLEIQNENNSNKTEQLVELFRRMKYYE